MTSSSHKCSQVSHHTHYSEQMPLISYIRLIIALKRPSLHDSTEKHHDFYFFTSQQITVQWSHLMTLIGHRLEISFWSHRDSCFVASLQVTLKWRNLVTCHKGRLEVTLQCSLQISVTWEAPCDCLVRHFVTRTNASVRVTTNYGHMIVKK